MEQIIGEFDIETGEFTVTAKGFKGKGCQTATKNILAALGGGGVEKLTPEYFEKPVTAVKSKNGAA
jgi:hypothetical protein